MVVDKNIFDKLDVDITVSYNMAFEKMIVDISADDISGFDEMAV